MNHTPHPHPAAKPACTCLLVVLLSAATTLAGTVSSSTSAPTVDGFEIANYGAITGDDKWWTENITGAGSSKGQTFTTGPAAVGLRSISYQVKDTQQAEPTKTYTVRVGTVAGTTALTY